jgi:hypothetical protein
MRTLPFYVLLCLVVICPESVLFAQEDSQQEKKPDIVREIVIPPRTQKVADEPPEQFYVKHNSAAEPVPALKYRFYPSRGELKPGNSVPFYYRLLIHLKSQQEQTRRRLDDVQEKYGEKPLTDLADPEARQEIEQAVSFIGDSQIDRNFREAVYRDRTDWDWQLNQLEGTDPITFYLEEAQEARMLARVMTLRTRLLAAQGKYAEAIESCLMVFKTGRDVAEPSTLINDLVGIAMSSIALADVRDMICQTDCPNLYWALASLPDPLISMRDGLEYEMAMPEIMFPILKDPETAVRSPEEWSRLVRAMFYTIQEVEGTREISEQIYDLLGSGLILRSYPTAKRELVAHGLLLDEQAESYSVGQVVAIYQKWVTQTLYHDHLKSSYLDFAKSELLRTEARRENALREFREPVPIAAILMPAAVHAKQAEIRLQSKIKGLMAVEAIRMHAAANGGLLPNSLDEIKAVPVPDCPMTGKPYVYQTNKDGASIIVPWATYGTRYSWQFHFKNN